MFMMDNEEEYPQRIAKENRRKKQKAEKERMPKSGMSLRLIPGIQRRRAEELEKPRSSKARRERWSPPANLQTKKFRRGRR